MIEVEKNDVDISKLFNWGKKFEIVGENDEVLASVYMRLLGDADINRARIFALRKSAEMRRKLTDKNSDEFLVYIKAIEEMSIEDLCNNIAAYSLREFTNLANKEVKIKLPKSPKSDAGLEVMEKHQKEIDAYPEKYYEAVQKFVDKETDKLKKALEKKSKDELYKMYVQLLTEEFCEQEAMIAYRNMEIFLGCFKDDAMKERFFKDFDEFDNLTTQVKSNFKASYSTLDLKMGELKKLRAATQ
jgi:hypothetical protein